MNENIKDAYGRVSGDYPPYQEVKPEKKGTSSESIPEKINRAVQEQEKEFKKSYHHFIEESRMHPIKATNIGSIDANDVCIMDEVVFKPGHEAAVKSKLCFKLIALVSGLEHTLVPSKAGTVKMMVPRKSFKKPILGYQLMPNGQSIALKENSKKIEIIQSKDEGHLVAMVGNKKMELMPTDRENVYKLKPFITKLDETLGEKTKEFTLVENDDEERYLVLKEHKLDLYSQPSKKGEREYVQVNNEPYYVTEVLKGNILLERARKNGDTSTKPPLPSWFSGELMRGKVESGDEADDEEIEMDEVLVPKESLVKFEFLSNPDFDVGSDDEEQGIKSELTIEGVQYEYEQEGTSYRIFPRTLKEEERTVFLSRKEGSNKGTLREILPLIKNGDDSYVILKGTKYLVDKKEKEAIKLYKMEEDVEGMVQFKVQNTCTKVRAQNVKGTEETKVVDVLKDNAFRKQFYERIDMNSFIDAFFSTILLRPQDGKMLDLPHSNFLFRVIPGSSEDKDPLNAKLKLEPVLIDLDEAMPEANDVHIIQEEGGKKLVHPIRNGLMGFPQARKKLSITEKEHALNILNQIIERKQDMHNQLVRSYLKKKDATYQKKMGILNINHIGAFDQVTERLKEFKDKNSETDWTLEDLFFYVFPEYQAQWNQIGDREPPEYKALLIGDESMENIEKRLSRT